MAQLDHEQTLARDTIGQSIIVSASAGAGKTSVLVERLLKRCLKDRVTLDRILAMTFTKAAAEEMKKRLASGLNSALSNTTDTQERSYIEDQLVALSAADITTIDSYCLSVIQKYYNVIGLDPAMTENILDASTEALYKHQAFIDAYTEMYENDPSLAISLASVFSPRPESYDKLEESIHTINAHANNSFSVAAFYEDARNKCKPVRSMKDFDEDLLHAYYDDLKLKCENLYAYLDEMAYHATDDEKIKPETLENKRNHITNCINALNEHRYSLFLGSLEGLELCNTSANTKNIPYSSVRKKLNDDIKKLLSNCYDEEILVKDANANSEIVLALIQLSQSTNNAYQRIKRDHTCMDFSDMERYVLDILERNHGETAKKIQASYDEIMVDEFQDTSELQNSIIEQIAREDNVFRVGDVKQSIYRFRSAKPSLMRNLLHDPKQKRITLRHNFRSKQSIVEFNNILFTKLMNIEGFQDTYDSEDTVTVGRDAQIEDPVPVEFVSVKVPDDRTGEQAKADWISEKILAMKEEGYSYKNFAVLVRSHHKKVSLKSSFDAYGIPYEIDEREGFFNSDLCAIVVSYVRFLLDMTDSVALAAILTSPLYEYSDADLAALKLNHTSIVQGLHELKPDFFEECENMKYIALHEGIPTFLQNLSRLHDFYNKLSHKDQANFDFLYNKLNNKEPVSLFALLEMMENGQDENSNEAVIRSKNDDLVTVTTIHQSKGLQYKVVFLLSDSQNRNSDSASQILVHDDLKIGLRYLDTNTRLERHTLHYDAIMHVSDMEDQQEFIRLLYVALTRPEERMFIVDSEQRETYSYSQSINRTSVASRKGMSNLIVAALEEQPLFHSTTGEIMHVEKAKQQTKKYASALPALKVKPAILPPVVTPSSTEFTSVPPLDLQPVKTGTSYGTKIHQTIEHLPNRVWTIEDFDESLSVRDKEKLINFSTSDIYTQCLSMHIEKEYNFFVVTDNETITGSMDFVAYDDTEVILIDFKTDHASNEEIKSRYTDQLNMYRKALEVMFPNKKIAVYAYAFHNESFIQI